MEFFRWQDISEEHPVPLQTRKVIHTPHTTIVRLASLKGTSVPLHHHVHEQITIMISGAFRIDLQGESVALRAGDVLRIEPDVPHQAEALEDSVTIEIFIPAREDWQQPGSRTGK
jgi:quercetin dioxygenase-like cupin family protein